MQCTCRYYYGTSDNRRETQLFFSHQQHALICILRIFFQFELYITNNRYLCRHKCRFKNQIYNYMIGALQIYKYMLEFHPTIVGWLIANKKVEKSDDKLVPYVFKDPKSEYITDFLGKVITIYPNGVKRISSSWGYGNSNFMEIRGCQDFSALIKFGIDVFDIGNSSERYCLTSKLDDLLEHFYDKVLDISIPDGYPRICGKSIDFYIKWLSFQVEYIKNNNFEFKSCYYFNFKYIGRENGFGDYFPEVEKNIKKHGIFAYKPIYKEIEWNFNLVEQYKDVVVWKQLMDDSNLIWNEEMLLKYDKYIPYCTENHNTFCDKFDESKIVTKYNKLGKLSNAFLENHKDVLDWRKVVECCDFSWDADELSYFCTYAFSNDMPYSTSFMDVTASSQIFYDRFLLADNPYFKWDINKLLAYLNLDDCMWDNIIEHRNLYKLFLAIPNVKELAQPYITRKNFWETICYNRHFPYDELSKDFTLDNIRKNFKEWSTHIRRKFITTKRTPDTNYSFYRVMTKWDYFADNDNVPLTYEIARYLKDVRITIGGSIVETDTGFIEEDETNKEINGLFLFSSHHIDSITDIEKIINDEDLIEAFFAHNCLVNEDITKYLVDVFFDKVSIEDYLSLVNNMKDWDNIKEIYKKEDSFKRGSSRSPNIVYTEK